MSGADFRYWCAVSVPERRLKSHGQRTWTEKAANAQSRAFSPSPISEMLFLGTSFTIEKREG